MSFIIILCYSFFILFTLYLFVFTLAGRQYKSYLPSFSPLQRRFVVFLPAYKEDAVIVQSAQNILAQRYPSHLFRVVVIADSLQADTLAALRQLPLEVVEVSFEVSTKSKALHAAFSRLRQQGLQEAFEAALIVDADNHLDPDFLTKINGRLAQGYQVVQGHRVAKNTDTPTALLDAISEEINNHIFRLGHRKLGLSAALIGSGMAFKYSLLEKLMGEIQAVGGFDKELEMRLLSQKIVIEYAPEALCFDEKVRSQQVFEQQRTRWIAAQIKYLKLNFLAGLKGLINGNYDYFDKVFQAMLPPRVLLLGVSMIGWLMSLWSPTWCTIATGQLSVLLLTLYLATPSYLRKQVTFEELRRLPALFIGFGNSICNIQQAKHRFIHTPHG